MSRSRSYFSAPGTMVTHTAAKRESVYTLRWLINFLRLPRTVLETEGPRASQPVSNIQLETRAKSSAEFPKAGFQDSIPYCTVRRALIISLGPPRGVGGVPYVHVRGVGNQMAAQ